jgi:hypothetical protein
MSIILGPRSEKKDKYLYDILDKLDSENKKFIIFTPIPDDFKKYQKYIINTSDDFNSEHIKTIKNCHIIIHLFDRKNKKLYEMLRQIIYNMSIDYTLFLLSAHDLPYEVSGSSPTIFLQKSKIKQTIIIGNETLSELERINKLNLPNICTI